MNIGDVAVRISLPVKTIRYYEDIGLVTPQRQENGYRVFRETDVHKLAFLGRARALGFSIEECRALLALWEDKARASSDVRAIAHRHMEEIEEKIGALVAMRDTLAELMAGCAGDNRPDCPILRGLEMGVAEIGKG